MTLDKNFIKFCKKVKTYDDFAVKLNNSDNKTKGDISEEFWKRWLWLTTHSYSAEKIVNANESEAKYLVNKFPELARLKVGSPNSRLADIIIDYGDEYSLVSAKWWTYGLTLHEVGALEGLDKKAHGYKSLRDKIIITNAPRTSQAAEDIFTKAKTSIKIFEEEFMVNDDIFQELITAKSIEKIACKVIQWRNERERESHLKNASLLRKVDRVKFQAPPGYGKTQQMYKLDKYFYKITGAMTISFADSVISLKQNFDHFNEQDRANGFQRPNLVICSGADDEHMVDWPVKVVGQDSVEIYKWLKENRYKGGRVWCFYGNTIALENAIGALKNFEGFAFGSYDEASRTCQVIGSGWSHSLYDKYVPIKKRFFVDATHRHNSKIGMDVSKLYGEPGDVVTQSDAEKYKSTCPYVIIGLTFDSKIFKIQNKFHERKMIKGKDYTVEDKAMMYQLISEFAQDPVMIHNLSFGLTLKRCRLLKNCAEDVIKELQTKYPKNKNFKQLSNIHIYVADTESNTSRDIREKLREMYKNKKKYKRTIVFTSRLLYRAWSQTKLDSVMFCDNYKSTSFIVQSIGRGLRYNKENPNKICKILMPVDLAKAGPWDHFLTLLNRLRDHDFRPIESIVALVKNKRSMAKRKSGQGGQVILNTNGVNIPIEQLKKGLHKSMIDQFGFWFKWNGWMYLARDYFAKLNTYSVYFTGNKNMNIFYQKIYNEIIINKNHKALIKKHMVGKQHRLPYVWLKDKMKRGVHNISSMAEYITYKAEEHDIYKSNQQIVFKKLLAYFDEVQEVRRRHIITSQEKPGFKRDEFMREIDALHNRHMDTFLRNVFQVKDQRVFKRDMIFGGKKIIYWAEKSESGSTVHNTFKRKNLDYIRKEVAKTEAIIKEGRTLFAEQVTKAVVEEHEKTYRPISKMKKFIVKKFGEDTAPWSQVWNRWIFPSPSYVKSKSKSKYSNKYTKKLLKYAENPLIEPGRPVCTKCKKKPCEPHYKNKEGYKTFLSQCSSCYRVSKEKVYIITSKIKDFKVSYKQKNA